MNVDKDFSEIYKEFGPHSLLAGINIFKYPNIKKFYGSKKTKEYLERIFTDKSFISIYKELYIFLDSANLFLPYEEFKIFIVNFKKFQQTRDNQYLGICIKVLPLILEIKIIRVYLEHLFYKLSRTKNNKAICSLEDLFKGLKKDVKKELGNNQFAYDKSLIKSLFEYLYYLVKREFELNKPKNKKARTQVIHRIMKEELRKKFVFLDRWSEEWARDTEPRRIALRIIQFLEAYERDSSFINDANTRFNPPHKIGINKLNEIVK